MDAPTRLPVRLLAAASLLALLPACGGEPADEAIEDAPPEAVVETPAGEPAPQVDLPDTTEAAVWAHLQDANYRESWALWPGRGELYEGTEPHGMLLTTYVNPVAQRALESGAERLPHGSVIVKENYMPDSTFAAATAMIKRDGYNPDHADWMFAKYDADGVAEAFGRAEGCQSCHSAQAGNDYVYTSELPVAP